MTQWLACDSYIQVGPEVSVYIMSTALVSQECYWLQPSSTANGVSATKSANDSSSHRTRRGLPLDVMIEEVTISL